MRICFITQNLNITDGGGRFSRHLVENFRKEGIEIKTIITEKQKLLLNFFKIRKIFKNSDIIHAVDIWPNGFYVRLISFGLKKPIVITALGTYSVAPFYSWRRFLMKWACNSAQLVAISSYTKEKIFEVMPKLKINVITPGFDFDFWSANPVVSEEISDLKPYLLSVGAMKRRKGYVNSIRAFEIVAKKIENLNYVIIGNEAEPDYAEQLREVVKKANLNSRVFFIKGVDDNQLLLFYKNAELFILTPMEENHHFEGFGIVYLEAAAFGLPIVASKNSGAESAVKDNYNGILVTQNNSEATADAILKIMENPELKNNLGKNGLDWVKNFSWDKITAEYVKIYSSHVKHY